MAAPRNLVNLNAVDKGYGSRSVLRDITLGVSAGDRIGVVGRNGDGKSTLLRLIAGAEDAGRRRGHPRRRARRGDARPGRRARRRPDDPPGAHRRARGPRMGRRRGVPLRARRADGGRRDRALPRRAGHGDRPAVGRGAAADRARAAAAGRAGAAAARRADQPPRPRGHRLARPPPRRPPWLAAGRHPRPLVPGRRLHARPGRSPTRRSTSTRAATPPTCWPAPSATASRPRARTGAARWCARSWRGCGAGRRRARRSRSSAIEAANELIAGEPEVRDRAELLRFAAARLGDKVLDAVGGHGRVRRPRDPAARDLAARARRPRRASSASTARARRRS